MANDATILGEVLILAAGIEEAAPYVSAAEKLRVSSILGIEAETQRSWEKTECRPALCLHFAQRESALAIVQYSMEHPLAAIIATHERTAPACARASSMMGLKWHAPRGADLCLDKTALRRRLSAAGSAPSDPEGDPAGQKVAVIAILDAGKLRVLSVVPAPENLSAIGRPMLEAVLRATREAGLNHGPMVAQVRIIGGQTMISDLCPVIPANQAETLRFRIPLVDEDISLAEVVMRHALGLDISRICKS